MEEGLISCKFIYDPRVLLNDSAARRVLYIYFIYITCALCARCLLLHDFKPVLLISPNIITKNTAEHHTRFHILLVR